MKTPQAAISKHVKNIFDSGELIPKATVSKMETVQKEDRGERPDIQGKNDQTYSYNAFARQSKMTNR